MAAQLLPDALPAHQDILLGCVADAKTQQNFSNAIPWAQSLKTGDRESTFNTIASSLAEIQPEQAGEFVLAQADPKLRDSLVGSVAKSWAAKDPKAASEWVVQLPEGHSVVDRMLNQFAHVYVLYFHFLMNAWLANKLKSEAVYCPPLMFVLNADIAQTSQQTAGLLDQPSLA